jgi:hypothetical protein
VTIDCEAKISGILRCAQNDMLRKATVDKSPKCLTYDD